MSLEEEQMDAVFDFGLAASRWLQETYPQLAGFFAMISSFGTEEFYLTVLPFIYWSWDKDVEEQRWSRIGVSL